MNHFIYRRRVHGAPRFLNIKGSLQYLRHCALANLTVQFDVMYWMMRCAYQALDIVIVAGSVYPSCRSQIPPRCGHTQGAMSHCSIV